MLWGLSSPHIGLKSCESSDIWGRVLGSWVHTGHMMWQLSKFSVFLKTRETGFYFRPTPGTTLPLAHSAGTWHGQPHLSRTLFLQPQCQRSCEPSLLRKFSKLGPWDFHLWRVLETSEFLGLATPALQTPSSGPHCHPLGDPSKVLLCEPAAPTMGLILYWGECRKAQTFLHAISILCTWMKEPFILNNSHFKIS